MGQRAKYAPDVSWEDVSTYVRQHAAATGYACYVVYHSGTGIGGADWVEARLVPAGLEASTKATVTARSTLPARSISRQMSVTLRTVAEAYRDLEDNPWLWTPEKRAQARGESA